MPLRFPFVLAVLLLGSAGFAVAQDDSRQSDEDACRPDVFRLCMSEIPDEDRIVACLNTNAVNLSPACRRVIAPETTVTRKRHPVRR